MRTKHLFVYYSIDKTCCLCVCVSLWCFSFIRLRAHIFFETAEIRIQNEATFACQQSLLSPTFLRKHCYGLTMYSPPQVQEPTENSMHAEKTIRMRRQDMTPATDLSREEDEISIIYCESLKLSFICKIG